jgi:hypothetical protein
MQAFHNDPQLKQDLLAEVAKHRLADSIIKGTYGEFGGSQFKGCAVGCSLKSYANIKGIELSTSNHGLYEEHFGIPRILARLEDRIFEGLPDDLAQTWPERFFNAIKPGADLTKVWPKFAIWLLIDAEHGVIKYASRPDCRSAIQRVAELYQSNGTKEEFRAAAAAAYAAAAAADAAAAAAAAYAADAADAAYAAADAAAAAAYAAADAADAAYAAADAADAAAAAAAATDAAYAAADAADAADAAADAATDAATDAADAAADAADAADAAADAATDAADAADARQKAFIVQSEKLLELMAEAE